MDDLNNSPLAIPRNLLPHSAVLKRPAESGSFFSDDEYVSVKLNFVRFEMHEKRRNFLAAGAGKGKSETRVFAGVMYYDCRNSLPEWIGFQTGDVISFSGTDYRVDSVKAVMGAREVHHYKLELS